jgi:hypothetical protein
MEPRSSTLHLWSVEENVVVSESKLAKYANISLSELLCFIGSRLVDEANPLRGKRVAEQVDKYPLDIKYR